MQLVHYLQDRPVKGSGLIAITVVHIADLLANLETTGEKRTTSGLVIQ